MDFLLSMAPLGADQLHWAPAVDTAAGPAAFAQQAGGGRHAAARGEIRCGPCLVWITSKHQQTCGFKMIQPELSCTPWELWKQEDESESSGIWLMDD